MEGTISEYKLGLVKEVMEGYPTGCKLSILYSSGLCEEVHLLTNPNKFSEGLLVEVVEGEYVRRVEAKAEHEVELYLFRINFNEEIQNLTRALFELVEIEKGGGNYYHFYGKDRDDALKSDRIKIYWAHNEAQYLLKKINAFLDSIKKPELKQ